MLIIVSQIDDERLATIFKGILGLFKEHEEVLIIGNAQLNSQLVDLAHKISKETWQNNSTCPKRVVWLNKNQQPYSDETHKYILSNHFFFHCEECCIAYILNT